MEDERDPFLEDEGENSHISKAEDHFVNTEIERPGPSTSPILNTPSLGSKFSNSSLRNKFRKSRPGVPLFNKNEDDLKIPLSSPAGGLLFSQEVSCAPKTPANKYEQRRSTCSGSDSEEDIFASPYMPCSDEVIPSALSALLDGPDVKDLSWTSSMATPLASNVTWSKLNTEENLNTEERNVFLPSADCTLGVKPRALFSPGLNDTADCHSLNASFDADCLLKGEKTDKTPKFLRGRNSYNSKTATESPLATFVGQNSSLCTPNQKTSEARREWSRDSPILSGSSEFKTSPDQCTEVSVEDEDLFENAEESEASRKSEYSIAESTPNILRKRKSPANEAEERLNSPQNEYVCTEPFLGDISVNTLEAVCKAEDEVVSMIRTPEKQTDSMRKRLLFSSSEVTPDTTVFKVPESKNKAKESSLLEDNPLENCIPDDSFMEHLAAMNTSIFSDGEQPVTKMQSVKTSVSHMKKFCYSLDHKPDLGPAGAPTSADTQTVMKEILNSVLILEPSSHDFAKLKTKPVKASGDLVVFSQFQEDSKQILGEDEDTLSSSTEKANMSKYDVKDDLNTSHFGNMDVQAVTSSCDGFQTASGNQITLSQEAISKGFNILKDAMEDKNSVSVVTEKGLSASECVQEKKKLVSSGPQCCSGSGKDCNQADLNDVEVAEEVKQLLKLVNEGEDFHSWLEMEQPPSSAGSSTEQEKKDCKSPMNSDGIDSTSSCGFSTASGKNIVVSEKYIARAQQLLQECEEDVSDKIGEASQQSKRFIRDSSKGRVPEFVACNRLSTSEDEPKMPDQVDRKRRLIQASVDNDLSTPSKKACLKSIPALNQQPESSYPKDKVVEDVVPAKISQTTKNFTKNCVESSLSWTKPASSSSTCEKNIDVSKKSVDKVKNLANGIPHEMGSNRMISQISCKNASHTSTNLEYGESALFTTASGKRVNVSKHALQKAKNLFNEVSEEHSSNDETEGSKESVTKSCHPLEVKGFSTASGKAVDVSENSINKARKIFEDIPSHSFEGDAYQEEQGEKSKNPRGIQMSSCQDTAGFSTASGKNVTVSKQALNKVKNLFNDLPEDKEQGWDSKRAIASASSTYFSTASGRRVDVSEKALNKVINLFDDIPTDVHPEFLSSSNKLMSTVGTNLNDRHQISDQMQPLSSTVNLSFSTASGKSVSVSQQAMNKVKGLFDDLATGQDFDANECPSALFKEVQEGGSGLSMSGFSTASGKTVSVSKEALNKVKNLFNEVASDACDEPKRLAVQGLKSDTKSCVESGSSHHQNVMEGFSTASGKTVSISEEALNKVKGLFDEDDITSEPTPLLNGKAQSSCSSAYMEGFSTAGGKSVPISKEALRKAQKLFDELPSESTSDLAIGNQETKKEDFSGLSVSMAGFSTAGGRAVHISETALSKVKNLFDDLPSEPMDGLEESCASSFPSGSTKAQNPTKDDSGVFMSHENTLNESSVCRTLKSSILSVQKSSASHNLSDANKENKNTRESTFVNCDALEIQKNSLTQEICASTAALLADDEFFDEAESSRVSAKTMKTICTSPSLMTDRPNSLKPILSASSENKGVTSEPTSPILVRKEGMGQRGRSRRGRLSLSTNVGLRSVSPTLGSQSNSSSQGCYRRPRLSLPSRGTSSLSKSIPPSTSEKCDVFKEVVKENSAQQSYLIAPSNPPPSRKLFADEVKMPSTDIKKSESTALKTESESSPIKISDALPLARSTHSTPLMRKILTKTSGPQSSGFKTPYKSPGKEPLKRLPSSPAQNPPDTKRRKSSTNLYVSHMYSSESPDLINLNCKALRPEVAEMRRRAAEEQNQLVKNFAEDKGEFLRPCVGSWLASKMQSELQKLKEIGQPQSYSSAELLRVGLSPSTVSVSADNSAEFRFSSWDYYSEDMCRENVAGLPVGDGALLVLDSQGTAGVEEVERSFLASPGVDPSLIPSGWVKNHYRWLVWKLAAVEWRFPHKFKRRCLSPHMLMLQLKYRYDREIDRCERPALRRILEHDDSAAKRMVLCVASITNLEDQVQLELTDGWYSLKASIDTDMQHWVRKGVIAVGTKLIMHGAELLNCPEGCTPLQVHPEVRLKLSSNSTRRARWYAKLGFQANPGPMKVSLGSILSSGGIVGCVTAYVARVYPLVFMEKTQERTVVRSQRAESKEVAKSENKRLELTELVYSQVQAEIQKEETKRRRSSAKVSLKHLSNLTTGEELLEILEGASDPHTVQSMLSEEQKDIIAEHRQNKQEELRREMEARVRLQLAENPKHDRQVTAILKVRLVSFDGREQRSSAVLSVWRPSEDVTSVFKEGHKLTIFGASANGFRCGELQLSANRSTRYHADSVSEINPDLLRTVSLLCSLSCHGFLPRFGELDIVGLVVRISPPPQTAENTTHFQNVYISDCHQNIISLSFRDGLKEFGVEDLVTMRSFVAASNLQWRGGTVVRAIPCVYASELSIFTTNPRLGYLQTAMQDLRRSLPSDLKTFVRACEDKLDNLLLQKFSSPTAYSHTPDPKSTLNASDQNQSILSTNLNVQNTTPTNGPSAVPVKAQRKLAMDQQLKTPSAAIGLSPAERLAKLERYGEPPPVSPIILTGPKRSLKKQFKPPRSTASPAVNSKKSE